MLRPTSFASLALVLTMGGAPLVAGCNNGGGGASVTPQSEEQKTLYALGLYLAKQAAPFNLKPEELNYVVQGMRDTVAGKKPIVELKEYGPKLGELARARQGAKSAEERKAGEAVLVAAAKEPGAEKLEGGLVYKSISEGSGEQPKASDRVKVNYKGTLRDGKVFDSSYDRGQPATFPLTGVVKCWTIGLQKMKVGGKAKLTCPADLAYGDRGQPNIPPGSALTFEVELLSIEPPGPAMPQQMPGMMGGHPAQIGGPMRSLPPGAMPPPRMGAPAAPGAKPAAPTATTPAKPAAPTATTPAPAKPAAK